MRGTTPVVIVLLNVALYACSSSTNTTPSTPAPSTPSGPPVTSIGVAGTPPAIGASSQFTAVATRSDGTTSAVTSQAAWRSSNSSVATVDAGGVVTGVGLGSVEISATYSDVRGGLTFTVTPAITYTIRVFVADATSSRPFPTAVVTYVGDRGSKTAVYVAGNVYSMTGVPAGSGTITVSAPGYIASSQSITVLGDMNLAFGLSPATACPTIGFDSLQSDGASFSSTAECGFVVRATTLNWTVAAGFGHPAPFVQLLSPAGTTTVGEISVSTSSGSPFKFIAVDIYSSTTVIPYVITGVAGSRVVFTIQNTEGNTFGNFVTVSNPQSATIIDGLTIRLSNPSAACCPNPMGLDNIRVSF